MASCFGERFIIVRVYETTKQTKLQVTYFGEGFAYHSSEWRAVMEHHGIMQTGAPTNFYQASKNKGQSKSILLSQQIQTRTQKAT